MPIRDNKTNVLCFQRSKSRQLKFSTSIPRTLLALDAIFDTCVVHLRSDDTNTPRSLSHSDVSNLILFSVLRSSINLTDSTFLLPKCIILHLLELSFISHPFSLLVQLVTESIYLTAKILHSIHLLLLEWFCYHLRIIISSLLPLLVNHL